MSGFEETWGRFQEATTTLGATPGVREAWHRGRRDYAVWALRVTGAEALARMAEVAGALRRGLGAAFLPQTAGDAHITAFVAGFPAAQPLLDDDVSLASLDRQAAALAGASPPRLALGGFNAFLSCPFLEIADPWGDLAALRARLAPSTREIRFAPYLPHLTLGALPEAVPTAAVVAAGAPFRGLPPLLLEIDAVELLMVDALHPRAPLRTARRVALTPPAPAAPHGSPP